MMKELYSPPKGVFVRGRRRRRFVCHMKQASMKDEEELTLHKSSVLV